ncbi:Carboxy-terminal processing protease CtpA precursor [Posidoniimonas polymericola]|uniref:Carboxy-terminal processing protease CtpA n=1 Tax=Posidoniimonas polymericola TaxID=2528002 RepID=A0A5C5YIB7_9BACT|nr:S41 family peptidase [Posidoniimonas polymericola]TWT74616.1 Carboxy-terminal processing protease CtpA precursor [Posidoniimonas polymericola]
MGNLRLTPLLLCLSVMPGLAYRVGAAERASPGVDQATQRDYLRRYGELAEVVTQIELNAATPVDRDRLFDAAIRGMLAELDPYSTYLPSETFQQLQRLAEESRPTAGVEFAIEDGRLAVLGVRAGSAAEDAGLQPGERVVAINGRSTERMTLAQADELAAAGEVRLTLAGDPPGDSRTVLLESRRLTAPTVSGVRMVDPGIAYARIGSFNANTAGELRDALRKMRSEGAASLVLDLRFNPGGLLEAAVDVADLFLEQGEIVSVVGRNGEPRVLSAGDGQAAEGVAVVVLVNRYSASASEVVAAALQDHGRATLVGERTFGKGSVQSVIALDEGRSGMKLTTAAYRRPSGANIHRFADATESDVWGVSPIEQNTVALTADQARRLHAAWGRGERPNADPQLARAIEQLRVSSQAE